MSFLEPLFLAGALTIAGPIVFHLIRRSPRGRLRFSSLRFLGPSPPRITRRSRLDDLLLLALRAAALVLIAIAFARPFLREAAVAAPQGGGTRAAILLDTSASLRRPGLWDRARARVAELLDAAGAGDELALFTFDQGVREIVAWSAGQRGASAEQIRAALRGIEPGWRATDLGGALVAAAESLVASTRAAGELDRAAPGALEVVLVSDLQEGSRLEALDRHEWPDGVHLRLERIAAPGDANAGIALLESGALPGAEERARVRVSNEPGAANDRFSLAWHAGDRPAGEAVPVQVPPGESRVVWLTRPIGADGAAADRIALAGDAADFDNTLHVAPPRRRGIAVLWIGDDDADEPQGLRFYLERAIQSGGVAAEVARLAPGEPLPAASGAAPPLAVVTRALEPPLAAALLELVRRGGVALCVPADAGQARSLGPLLECDGLRVEEAPATDYAILADVDFRHPLLATFAGRSFGDFSQVRFWRHRRLVLPSSGACGLHAVARFDDGDPAWVVKEAGRGRIVLLLSGWQPRDSQLALSTKFVPLLSSFCERPGDSREGATAFAVGDPLPLPAAPGSTGPQQVRRPDGTIVEVSAGERSYLGADARGIYTLDVAGERRQVAVNLAADESRTAPLDAEELERRGVRLAAGRPPPDRARQLRDIELERSQGLWKWLLTAALAILILETGLAAARARRLAATPEGA